jgi:hypothetical protein
MGRPSTSSMHPAIFGAIEGRNYSPNRIFLKSANTREREHAILFREEKTQKRSHSRSMGHLGDKRKRRAATKKRERRRFPLSKRRCRRLQGMTRPIQIGIACMKIEDRFQTLKQIEETRTLNERSEMFLELIKTY